MWKPSEITGWWPSHVGTGHTKPAHVAMPGAPLTVGGVILGCARPPGSRWRSRVRSCHAYASAPPPTSQGHALTSPLLVTTRKEIGHERATADVHGPFDVVPNPRLDHGTDRLGCVGELPGGSFEGVNTRER